MAAETQRLAQDERRELKFVSISSIIIHIIHLTLFPLSLPLFSCFVVLLFHGGSWKRWGPYLCKPPATLAPHLVLTLLFLLVLLLLLLRVVTLCGAAERQWGTVREDYSADGAAWSYFSHDQARSRAYRWGEDGLLGWTDRECRLCFGLALWNEHDPILKERLFGLTGSEGNHGEDVKENYYYLDSTPTHSYVRMLYKYPHAAYPYEQLLRENRARGLDQREYELEDTGVFAENRYFDVQVEYAKGDPDETYIKLSITNHGPEPAPLHLLPTLWSVFFFFFFFK